PRPFRRRGGGGASATAADPDDLDGLHPRRDALGLGGRCRRRTAPDAWYGGFLGYDRRHRLRADLHAGVLRGFALVRGALRRAATTFAIGQTMTMKFGFGQPLTRKEDD